MKDMGKTVSESSMCFKEASSYDLTIDSKKIVGSAQYRRRKRFFQHGSILLDVDWDVWNKLWKIPEASTVLKDRVTSFGDRMEVVPEIEDITAALTDKLSRFFQTDTDNLQFSETDLAYIRKLEEKYCI
ncbi:MAG: hypothetical protein GY866_28750 [Proteobacteria bacterium]|nr:hypothetical protein [Pseudomonadota bacterium]